MSKKVKNCILKIDEDIRYENNFDLLNKLKYLYKFCNISFNFEDTKMADQILKISRPGGFDVRCLG